MVGWPWWYFVLVRVGTSSALLSISQHPFPTAKSPLLLLPIHVKYLLAQYNFNQSGMYVYAHLTPLDRRLVSSYPPPTYHAINDGGSAEVGLGGFPPTALG